MLMSHLHEYHFVMDSCMKEKLQDLTLYKKTGSLSGVIMRVLLFLIPVIRREHKWGKQRMSRYMLVNNDPNVKREHVHVYIPESLYRQMKLLHQDLNFYSIAQLARGLLEFFLSLVEEYGDDIIKELKKVFRHWKMEEQKTRLSPHEFVRQLMIITQHLLGQNRLINIYNNQFSPFWIFRL